ncbi:MAG: response regulator [Chloroflexota bacterium]|nr:response regulator [Chloroflexota bacterium]
MAHILIVDDEPDVVEFLAEELELAGWETGTASNGVEGVLRVLDGGWDALLMDIRMPELDGINALRIIRRITPDLPVVTFTGHAGRGEMLESTRLGARACLLKPITMDKLIETIRQVLT